MKTSEEVIALEKPAVVKTKLGAFLAGFGKTNAHAPTVSSVAPA